MLRTKFDYSGFDGTWTLKAITSFFFCLLIINAEPNRFLTDVLVFLHEENETFGATVKIAKMEAGNPTAALLVLQRHAGRDHVISVT